MQDNFPFLIHPGYPKSATTSIQRNIFTDTRYFHSLSRRVRSPDGFNSAGHTVDFFKMLTDDECVDEARINELWQQHILPHAVTDRWNILSEEGFLRAMSGLDKIPNKIRSLVGEAKVLITVRSQEDLLRSMYDMRVKTRFRENGTEIPFPEWIELIFSTDRAYHRLLHFREVIDQYSTLFGSENVLVLDVASISSSDTGFRALESFLGLEANALPETLPQSGDNNASQHEAGPLISKMPGTSLKKFLPRTVKKAMRGRLEKSLSDVRTKIDPSTRARIQAFYAGSTMGDLTALTDKAHFVLHSLATTEIPNA